MERAKIALLILTSAICVAVLWAMAMGVNHSADKSLRPVAATAPAPHASGAAQVSAGPQPGDAKKAIEEVHRERERMVPRQAPRAERQPEQPRPMALPPPSDFESALRPIPEALRSGQQGLPMPAPSPRLPSISDNPPRPPGTISAPPVPVPARTRVDEALSKLNKALVGFNTPETMTTGQRLEIRAILTHELSHEELTTLVRESARAKEGVTISELRASDLMTASLSSDNGIAVEPPGPQKQWVSATEPTEWRWQITALRQGEHRIILEFFALLNIAGDVNPRHIRTLSKTILVHVERSLLGQLSASIGAPLGFTTLVGFLLFVSATLYVGISRRRVLHRFRIPVWLPSHTSELVGPKHRGFYFFCKRGDS